MSEENKSSGWELISAYSRADALEDGVLVDVSSLAREAGFKYPFAVTQAVWGILKPTAALEAEGQSYEGRLWDLLTILRFAVGVDASRIEFAPLFVREPGGEPVSVQLVAVCGPGDDAAPVITVMLPGED